jgi:hypothetical protein
VTDGRDAERYRRAQEEARRLRAEAETGRRLRDDVQRLAVRAGSLVGGRVVGGDLAAVLHVLEERGWRVLHGVRRRGSPLAPLDHVLVGPQGAAAVGQVHFAGVVAVVDGTLRLNGAPYALETREFAAAVTGLGTVTGPGVPLRAVLCPVPGELAHAVARPGVDVVGRSGLAALVTSGPGVLSPDAVEQVVARVTARLRTGDGLRRPRAAGPVDDAGG